MTWRLDSDSPLRGKTRVRRHVHTGNGLRVLSIVDHAAPVVSYQTWYGVGSADERTGKTGLAHFFEHLMFTQTANHGPGVFDRTIESCGGDTNAATWLDWTYYRDSVPAAELEPIVALEADRMRNLVLTSEVVEAEREVILNERRERVDDDIDGFLDETLMAAAFGDHPYGWPTIGWRADIENLSIADLEDFYRRHYAPDNATLVVVGAVDEAEILKLADRYYRAIPAAGRSPRPPSSGPEVGEATRTVTRKPVTAERALYGWVGPAQNTRDWAILDMVSHILAGSPSSRLYRELVVEKELASSVSCSILPLRLAGFFELSIHAAGDHRIDECEPLARAAIAALAEIPPDKAEIDKVKAGMLTDFWSELISVDGKADSLGHHELTCGDYRALMEVPEIIGGITGDELSAACRRYLERGTSHAVVAVPE